MGSSLDAFISEGMQQGGGPAECRPTGRGRRECALKALVTGGAGFIGSNVVKVLIEHGHDVECAR